eukprot:TRINITY_DN2304_c0_g1_i1.p1 TRINITY_DN2304_c0_g1~~TRINITY_DN2304_c0_g1_i1.p1  ORF type:complete len:344 (+),score=21.95 TRINITY_DN2304_c0_g1_i1:137-1033(+)
MEGHEHEVKSVSFSVSGQHLATCSRDKSVWVWEVVESGGECECVAVLSGHAQDVKMVRWHPTQEVLASCGYDDTIKIWKEDEYDWSDIHTMEGHDSTVWGICFNVDGSKLVSCSDDRTIIVWESVEDMAWRQACTLSGYHDRAIYTVDWSHVTGRIASGSGADDIAVFEAVPTGREEPPSFVCTVKHERAHQGDVNSVQWNPHQGNMLASAGDDGLVRIWEYCEGQWLYENRVFFLCVQAPCRVLLLRCKSLNNLPQHHAQGCHTDWSETGRMRCRARIYTHTHILAVVGDDVYTLNS